MPHAKTSRSATEVIADVEQALATLRRPLTEWGSPNWKRDKENAQRDLLALIPDLVSFARIVEADRADAEYRVSAAPGFDTYPNLKDAERVAARYADRGAVIEQRTVSAWVPLA